MDISLKQYQSLNISASASFSTAQGRENERRDWTEETYLAKNKQPGNRYDWSRRHLNFEIKSGKKITTRNDKTVYIPPRIVRLGTQRKSLKKRYEQRLKELNFKPWREDAPNQPNTCVDFVISGDHDRMTEIAFGKPMDFDWQEDNSWVSLADDPNHPGMKMIETMAMDYYDFLCRKFGEENVIGLECHLDETTPHFHALVIPVAERVKRGRVGGYEIDPDVESDGKERPEHITTRQFERLKEEEQSFYRPAPRSTPRSRQVVFVSPAAVMPISSRSGLKELCTSMMAEPQTMSAPAEEVTWGAEPSQSPAARSSPISCWNAAHIWTSRRAGRSSTSRAATAPSSARRRARP